MAVSHYFSGASVAGVTAPISTERTARIHQSRQLLCPLLLVSYFTFKTALGRVDDANRHLSELNRLYLSTIETLAMAIDAKDQITHGHIRRVQQYAIGLAVELASLTRLKFALLRLPRFSTTWGSWPCQNIS